MKKIFNKKTAIYLLSAIIPLIIIVGYAIIREMISKGHYFYNGNAFLLADAGSQYFSLYHYIHNVLIGKDSIFYSFYNNLGGNMSSIIGYYLSSPLNILYMFVSKTNIAFMTFIIYSLKISLCSLFMSIYLCNKFGHKYTNIIFSLIYAFMGFVIVYYFNSMWLDVIYMTPLVIMGIDRLIEGKPLTYIITLSLSIIFNFYMAYMLCIFCVIYFIYELIIRYGIKNIKKYDYIVRRFVLSSLLAVGLSAFFLIPVIFNLSETLRYPIDPNSLNIKLNDFVENIITKSYIGSHGFNSLLGRKRPVIYINLFSMVLSIFYLLNSKISKRERILSFSIIIFFLLSFSLPYLELFWQGFSLPNGYIDRFSFLYCFFLILISAKQFYSSSLPKLRYILIFLLVYVFFSIYVISKKLNYISNLNIILSIIFVLIYICMYVLKNKNNNRIIKKIISIVLIIFIMGELLYNYAATFLFIDGSRKPNPFPNDVCYKNKDDESFYRVDYYAALGYSESYVCEFYTSRSALSANNGKLHKFMHDNGASLAYMYTTYENRYLPVFASIVGTKYLYGDQKLKSNIYDKYSSFKTLNDKNQKEKQYVYKNPYALSLGFAIDDKYDINYKKNKKNIKSSLDNLNNLFVSISGVDKDILTMIPKRKIKPLEYKFDIDKDTDYLYFTADYDEVINFTYYSPLYINDLGIATLDTFKIGTYSFENKYYNQEMDLSLDDDELIEDINLYYFDKEVFEEGINKLKKNQLKNIKISGNKMSSNINLDKDSTIFISIPYDKGWKVYVDGKKVKTVEIADMFMGVKVPKGNHKITMKFYPRGLKLGVIISVTSLCLIIYLQRKGVRKNDKKHKRKNKK